MIGAYVRVSSAGQNLQGQRAEIENFLTRHGMSNVRWFEDQESGATLKRPGFQALQKAIASGDIDTVIVFRLDRLARSYRQGVSVLADWCEKNVRIIATSQQIDLSGTIGQLVAGVLFAFAEIEREAIRERQKSGIEAAKRKGLYLGRKRGSRIASPYRAKKLRESGLTHQEIANALKVSRNTVINYLKTEEVE